MSGITLPPAPSAGGTPEGYDVVLDDPDNPTTGHVAVGEIQELIGSPDFYTAVGHAAHVASTATAIGTGAGAKEPGSVALGYGATVDVGSANGTAIGNGAHVTSTSDESTAIGHGAVPINSNEVRLGRDTEYTSLGLGVAFHGVFSQDDADEPGNPSSHQGILFVRITSGGKRQLCVRLGAGNGTDDPIIVIATEA